MKIPSSGNMKKEYLLMKIFKITKLGMRKEMGGKTDTDLKFKFFLGSFYSHMLLI